MRQPVPPLSSNHSLNRQCQPSILRGKYLQKRNLCQVFFLFALSVAFIAEPVQARQFWVQVDKPWYYVGDTVTITWHLYMTFDTATLTIIYPTGSPKVYTVNPRGPSTYTSTFTQTVLPGSWRVVLHACNEGEHTDSTEFMVVARPPRPYSVTVHVAGFNPASYTNLFIDEKLTGTIIGGESRTLPFDSGTNHNITVDQYVYVEASKGTRYYCSSNTWAFSSAGVHTFNYDTYYYLTVISKYGGHPKGEGWYKAGSIATVSVSTPVLMGGSLGLLGGEYKFRAWRSGWRGFFGLTDPTIQVTINEPQEAEAVWDEDYTTLYYIGGVACFVALLGVAWYFEWLAWLPRSFSWLRKVEWMSSKQWELWKGGGWKEDLQQLLKHISHAELVEDKPGELLTHCTKCHAIIRSSDKFCGWCGSLQVTE